MSRHDTSPRSDGREAVTLVLGGGGARGLAHLGVFRVLEEAGIPVRAVVGNSAGAMAAVLMQQTENAKEAMGRMLEYLDSPRFRRLKLAFRMPRNGEARPPTVVSRLLSGWRRQVAMHLLFRRESLFHSRRLEGVLNAVIREGKLEDLPLPTVVVALDLASGEEVELQTGSIRKALLASCSVAGFFPPVALDGRRLIDCGQANNLPVQSGLRFGHPVIAVNLSGDLEVRDDFATGIEIMFRSEEIGSRCNTRLRAVEADVHICPDLTGRYWLDFHDPEEAVRAGEQATRAVLPRIEALLDRRPRTSPGPSSDGSALRSST